MFYFSLPRMISQEELFFNNNQQTVYNLITGLIDSHDDVFVPPILVSGNLNMLNFILDLTFINV